MSSSPYACHPAEINALGHQPLCLVPTRLELWLLWAGHQAVLSRNYSAYFLFRTLLPIRHCLAKAMSSWYSQCPGYSGTLQTLPPGVSFETLPWGPSSLLHTIYILASVVAKLAVANPFSLWLQCQEEHLSLCVF